MNLRLGAVPDAGAFDPEAEGFVSLREPDDSTFLEASIPVSWVIFVLLACGWEVWWPGGCYLLGLVDFAVGIVAVIVVHEWIHALTLPDQGAGENTVFGFYPRHLIFYTHYEGPIDRDQFLLTLVSPFVMLSVIPLVFCASLGEASTLLDSSPCSTESAAPATSWVFFSFSEAYPRTRLSLTRGRKRGGNRSSQVASA